MSSEPAAESSTSQDEPGNASRQGGFDGVGRTVLHLNNIGLRRGPKIILDSVSFKVESGQRWVVLGPNGCGKTSLLSIAAMRLHPTVGEVELLSKRLGDVDIRDLRRLAGYMSANLASSLRPTITAIDVVVCAKYDALEPWWHTYHDSDYLRGSQLLAEVGCEGFGQRNFSTLSSGEQQRVLLARSLFNNPPVLLLDEPAAALDIAGREQLVRRLAEMADTREELAVVLVTHHLEEIPENFTHILLMRDGTTVTSGSIEETLTEENLSETFSMDLRLLRSRNRLFAVSNEP